MRPGGCNGFSVSALGEASCGRLVSRVCLCVCAVWDGGVGHGRGGCAIVAKAGGRMIDATGWDGMEVQVGRWVGVFV